MDFIYILSEVEISDSESNNLDNDLVLTSQLSTLRLWILMPNWLVRTKSCFGFVLFGPQPFTFAYYEDRYMIKAKSRIQIVENHTSGDRYRK